LGLESICPCAPTPPLFSVKLFLDLRTIFFRCGPSFFVSIHSPSNLCESPFPHRGRLRAFPSKTPKTLKSTRHFGSRLCITILQHHHPRTTTTSIGARANKTDARYKRSYFDIRTCHGHTLSMCSEPTTATPIVVAMANPTNPFSEDMFVLVLRDLNVSSLALSGLVCKTWKEQVVSA